MATRLNPSGSAFLTERIASVPLAPGRASTTTRWGQMEDSLSASTRVTSVAAELFANGDVIVTGRVDRMCEGCFGPKPADQRQESQAR